MPKLPIYQKDGKKAGEIELKDSIFGVAVHKPLLHQSVVLQMNNERQGTAATKTRGLVRGGGRKPYRQKGTGRARHGSSRSPLWRGGGVIFGPEPREYKRQINKKANRLALKSALSAKALDGAVKVIKELSFAEPKTKEMVDLLSKLKLYPNKTLIVLAEEDVNAAKSARNIPGVKTVQCDKLNVYDLLLYDNLLLTGAAASRVEEVLA
ncbi:MAG: 50S ribosomal protein L4 [Bacillota bacterium]